MTITTRAGKGSALTHNEQDANFTDLRDGIGAQVPKTKNATGFKIGPNGSSDYGWHDLIGYVHLHGGANTAVDAVYRGGIRAIQMAETKEAFVDFHLPHDYVPGTDLHIHVHWSHTSTTLTGGSVTWGCEMMYAKGHDQAAFPAPTTVSFLQSANTTQYQHMIAETAASVSGGSGTQLDTDLIEVDGIIQCRVFLDSNDLTDSGTVPDPFVHFVDIHYQSTGVATKNKTPDFWT